MFVPGLDVLVPDSDMISTFSQTVGFVNLMAALWAVYFLRKLGRPKKLQGRTLGEEPSDLEPAREWLTDRQVAGHGELVGFSALPPVA